MKPHTRKDFDEELATLHVHVRAMAERCLEALGIAMEMLGQNGPPPTSAIDQVLTLDRQINDDEIQIDRLVFQGFALEQPVAQDLRMLAATFKLTTDLERIGDEAVNIAKCASEARGSALDVVRADLSRMFCGASRMVEDAVSAFVDQNAELAARVGPSDDEIDRAYAQVLKRVADHLPSHANDCVSALHVLDVARNLERIADHATNIAEETIFAVRGDDTRHAHPVHTG